MVFASDYYPFGMAMPERSFDSPKYRYGFNGKEKDEDGEWGSLTHYDYGFRIYNPGIGRFLSVDPLSRKYPYFTPYHFSANSPILFQDFDGEDFGIRIDHKNKTIVIVATIFTISETSYNQARSGTKQWNNSTANVEGYTVSFEVSVKPPLPISSLQEGLYRLGVLAKRDNKIFSKKGRLRKNRALKENLKFENSLAKSRVSQAGGTGNLFRGNHIKGKEVSGSEFVGGFTANNLVIDMNMHEDAAIGDLGNFPDLVAHEIGHLFGLDDEGKGPHFNEFGVMKYKGTDLNPISPQDIGQIIDVARAVLNGSKEKGDPSVKIISTIGSSDGSDPLAPKPTKKSDTSESPKEDDN